MRAIADRVDHRIKAGAIGADDVRGHRRLVDETEGEVARIVGVVRIRLLHQEAIDEGLESPKADQAVVRTWRDATTDDVAPHREGEERVHPHSELVATLQLAEDVEVRGAALDVRVEDVSARDLGQARHVVDRRDPDGPEVLESKASAREDVLEARWRDQLDHSLARTTVKNSGRLARDRIAFHSSASWIGSGAAEPRARQRLRVGDVGAVHAP